MGIFDKLFGALKKTKDNFSGKLRVLFSKNKLGDEFYEELEEILISSDVGVKKPSPEIFKIAFETFGISEENSVYIGNDLHDDILGASGVGMKTVYIETPQSRKYENGPKPTYTVKNHFEMKELLLSL